jgi:hypothetical protein
MNRQEIAENATSALTRVTALRNRFRFRVAFANRGENFQFDGGLDCFSQLVCIDRIEEALWNRLLDWYGHELSLVTKYLPIPSFQNRQSVGRIAITSAPRRSPGISEAQVTLG